MIDQRARKHVLAGAWNRFDFIPQKLININSLVAVEYPPPDASEAIATQTTTHVISNSSVQSLAASINSAHA